MIEASWNEDSGEDSLVGAKEVVPDEEVGSKEEIVFRCVSVDLGPGGGGSSMLR